ncbi:probable G-protein coupled receptor 139 [Leucoraja erinacea]|uniref:probable G-protein coupled receptor 139 n=1 Tax=Leucoraja erinaceus TaxID=7782 RepID=UPI0024560E6B|nr:probable G-protein coupled receptor 139 [Leucoraja erinacea]
MAKNIFWALEYVSADYDWLTVDDRIWYALFVIQPVYYPLLGVVAVPVNTVTIVILSRGKCGLSKGVTRYLEAMATADLLVVIFDLIMKQLPMVYREQFSFVYSIYVCNIHAVVVAAVTDCSVWFTVAFTFDRFVAISCQKLRTKYCTERTAAVVLGTMTVLSSLKNIFWYFMLRGEYHLDYVPWFCRERAGVLRSSVWAAIEFLHYLVTPGLPFALILLLNVLTAKYVLVAGRARKRLRDPSLRESVRDPEMESRRKSLILLLVISGNFILLWSVYMVYNIWGRIYDLRIGSSFPPNTLQELGFMLQLLSCCTNTALYAVTQTKFRQQLKDLVKYPFTLTVKFLQRRWRICPGVLPNASSLNHSLKQ